MIQRIQSLYLVLAGGFLVLFAAFTDRWAVGLPETWAWVEPFGIGIAALAAVVAFAAVALYKDRARQRTLIVVAQVVTLLTVATAVAWLFLGADETGAVGRYVIALFPVLAYVTLRLAQRGVDKDIALVRSMDRLR